MKNLLASLTSSALLIGSLFAPVAVSAAPLICNGPGGLVFALADSCAAANVGVFPGFTIGQCLVIQADLSLAGGTCGGGGGGPTLAGNNTWTGQNTFNNAAGVTIGTSNVGQMPEISLGQVAGNNNFTLIGTNHSDVCSGVPGDFLDIGSVGFGGGPLMTMNMNAIGFCQGINVGTIAVNNVQASGTALVYTAGTLGTDTTSALAFGISTGSSQTQIGADSSRSVSGVSCDAFQITFNSDPNSYVCMDVPGNLGIRGNVLAGGTVQSAGDYVPVRTLADGTAGDPTHCVISGRLGFTATGTPQAVTFTGAAVFRGFYTLVVNDNGPTTFSNGVPITAKSTTGFTFTATNFGTDTYSYQACGE
jgi:hypothetical protein